MEVVVQEPQLTVALPSSGITWQGASNAYLDAHVEAHGCCLLGVAAGDSLQYERFEVCFVHLENPPVPCMSEREGGWSSDAAMPDEGYSSE
eukprot:5130276-Amphidinium_carterae.1